MAEKQVTNNELARMIKKGFDDTATRGQFENLDKRLGAVEKDVKSIGSRMLSVEKKLERVEEVLTDMHVL